MELETKDINPLHKTFKTIGLVGTPRRDPSLQMHKNIFAWLQERGYHVLVDEKIGAALQVDSSHIATLDEIGERAQLAIVIGGDGNMLGHARVLSKYDIVLIGINRGNLGFLTDIDPSEAYSQLQACLDGEFFVEERFLLNVKVERAGEIINRSRAVNDAILRPAKTSHMIDFHVYINDKFAFSQRSDGLIISTPTGSTAYSLSAGGPILMPKMNAISLVPMYPHTLSARPLVIDGDSKISLRFADYTNAALSVSCDNQVMMEFESHDVIRIEKSAYKFRLVHLNNYNYYNVLRTKLGWLKKLF